MTAAPLLARARRINTATVFLPGFRDRVTVEGLDDLVLAAQALDAGPLAFVPTLAHYPDLDPFLAITVRSPRGDYLATLADRWTDQGDRAAALAVLRAAEAQRHGAGRRAAA